MNAKFKTGMIALAVAGSSFLASCSSKITAEQLATLRQLRAQEAQLKQDIQTKKNELSRLKSEADARQKEVDNCNSRKQFVQSKLAQWPNAWPAGLFPED